MQKLTEAEYRTVADFIYRECQLADEGRWDEWEELLADDMHYWVPVNPEDADPDRDVSIINDNRSRLATRLRQLRTGTRHSQAPRSAMRRMISNLVVERHDQQLFRVEGNFVVYEFQNQSTGTLNVWPGRVRYHLRQVEDSFEIVLKRVELVMAGAPIPTLAFII